MGLELPTWSCRPGPEKAQGQGAAPGPQPMPTGFGIDLLPAGGLALAAPSLLWLPRFCRPPGCCLGTQPWLLEVGRPGSGGCLVSREQDGRDRGGGGQLSQALRVSQAPMTAFWWVWGTALLKRGLSVSCGRCGGCCGRGHWAVGPGAWTLTASISCSPRTPASRLCFWISCLRVAQRLSAAVMSVPRA